MHQSFNLHNSAEGHTGFAWIYGTLQVEGIYHNQRWMDASSSRPPVQELLVFFSGVSHLLPAPPCLSSTQGFLSCAHHPPFPRIHSQEDKQHLSKSPSINFMPLCIDWGYFITHFHLLPKEGQVLEGKRQQSLPRKKPETFWEKERGERKWRGRDEWEERGVYVC